MDAVFTNSVSVPVAQLKMLRLKSNVKGAIQTLSHMAAIAINTLFLNFFWGSFWAVPIFMIQGILINCLYAGVHELSHDTVFKTKKLNKLAGRLFGFILLIGRDQDKFEHFQHHRHTQDIELDAEIIGGKPFNLFTYLLYFTGVSYWPGRIQDLFRSAIGRTTHWSHLSVVQAEIVHREARVLVLLYSVLAALSVYFQSWALVIFWLLPMITMKWFQMMQNIVEHTGMPHDPNILTNTRTVKANRIMRWLLWNMPFHMAHHSYPMIPFHNLPQLQSNIVDKLGYEPQNISHIGFQIHMIRKLIKDGSSRYSGNDISTY